MSNPPSSGQLPSDRNHKMHDNAHLDPRSVPAMLRGQGNGLERQWRRFADRSHETDVEIIDLKFRQLMERKLRRKLQFKLGMRRLFWMSIGGLLVLFLCLNHPSTIRQSSASRQVMTH
jgi:hypothetical protein